jgi:hypothetical protein
MKSVPIELVALAALASATTLGCGSSRTGGMTGGSGGVTGSGGVVQGSGGVMGSGGTASVVTGTGGAGAGAADGGASSGTHAGGVGSGGSQASGGGSGRGAGVSGAGGVGTGGAGGRGSSASDGSASGGTGTGGTVAGGTGGGPSGGTGAGGAGAGGVISLDAGCTGVTCAQDAAATDASLPTCTELTSTECNLRYDCHSVYKEQENCTCTEESCCLRFDHCADEDLADCTGPALCNTVAPVCEGRYYTVAFKNDCYEGCVRKNECKVPACAQIPPSNGTPCGPVDYPCFYQDCAGDGRTLATCSGGTWTVETTACSSVTCEGVGVSPAEITCATGQVCVRTSTSNVVFTLKPTCVENTCGSNPISPACLTGLSGICSVEVSASGGSIYCVVPSPCDGTGGCSYTYP